MLRLKTVLLAGAFLAAALLFWRASSTGTSALAAPAQLPTSPSDSVPAQAPDPAVLTLLRNSLASTQVDVRESALAWIARDPRAQQAEFIPAILGALNDTDGTVRDRALSNMAWIFEREPGSESSNQALAAIESALQQAKDRGAQLAAVDLLRGSAERGTYDAEQKGHAEGRLLSLPEIQDLVARLLADSQSSLRPQLLTVVQASATLQGVPEVVEATGKVLGDDSLTVRSDAADLLISINRNGSPAVRRLTRPILLAALRDNDPNVQLRVSNALGLPIPPRPPAPPVISLTGAKINTANVPFDFNYFTAFVQPLFVKKYGNASCVDCHTPQANASGSFRILAPGPGGRYTLEQSRVNFVSILAVIDRNAPEKSKLLLKPLDPRATEGGLNGLTHDGGVFWSNRFDPDFEIVDDWLKGAKLETPPEKQLDFAYFAQNVEPIFSTPGPDGIACVNCHSTHAILHLLSPETSQGKFSIEQIVNNYQSAHRVVDEAAPANSLIVRKPTSPREGEQGGIAHAGGVRWPDKKESWQYKTLMTWAGMYNLAQASKQSAAAKASPPAVDHGPGRR